MDCRCQSREIRKTTRARKGHDSIAEPLLSLLSHTSLESSLPRPTEPTNLLAQLKRPPTLEPEHCFRISLRDHVPPRRSRARILAIGGSWRREGAREGETEIVGEHLTTRGNVRNVCADSYVLCEKLR